MNKYSKKFIPYYEEKMYFLGNKHEYCVIAKSQYKRAKITELHHTYIHNTCINRRRFPLLVNSIWNLSPVNHSYHMDNDGWGKIGIYEADWIEKYLADNSDVANVINFSVTDTELLDRVWKWDMI